MKFLTAVHTDVGIKKKTNQDSALVMEAETDFGNVLFAAVCDGMGGLAKGEVASAALIREFAQWFEQDFPKIIYSGITEEAVRQSMENVIFGMNLKISSYGRQNGVHLGTTVVALIIAQDKYYCINVGDSRCYHIKKQLDQITIDQTFVQREMDMGRMTLEQARVHPQRNVLLQCVGSSEYIIPDFFTGDVCKDEMFLLCSDGYRHLISSEELYQYLNPYVATDERRMLEGIRYFTELNKYRHEEDNITSVLLRTEP